MHLPDKKGFTTFMRTERGFTLVELLVVISIIAILSVIGITIFTNAQNSAKNAKVKADLDAIYKNIEQSRILQQKTLQQITQSNCSSCNICRTDSTHTDCITAMKAQYAKITTAEPPLDPWGGAYLFDENEGEDPPPACIKDTIGSNGSDHTSGTADDTTFALPTMFC